MATTQIKNGFNGGSDDQLLVNPDGSINVSGTSTITGSITSHEAGLNSFKTSQYTLDTTEIQVTPTALVGRSSISLKVVTTGTNVIYFSDSAGTALSDGYPLYNGDSVQMDLTPSGAIYAVATAPGQKLFVLEIA